MVHVKRFLVIFISLVLSYVLQMLVLPKIPYLITVPNLLLAETLSIGFLYGRGLGLLTGVISGLLLDIMGIGVPGFYTLILAWLGFLDGLLSEKMESELIFALFLLLLLNEAVYHGYILLLGFLVNVRFSFIPYIKEVFAPEVLLTMVCFLFSYGILIFVSKRWNLRVNRGEVKVV